MRDFLDLSRLLCKLEWDLICILAILNLLVAFLERRLLILLPKTVFGIQIRSHSASKSSNSCRLFSGATRL